MWTTLFLLSQHWHYSLSPHPTHSSPTHPILWHPARNFSGRCTPHLMWLSYFVLWGLLVIAESVGKKALRPVVWVGGLPQCCPAQWGASDVKGVSCPSQVIEMACCCQNGDWLESDAVAHPYPLPCRKAHIELPTWLGRIWTLAICEPTRPCPPACPPASLALQPARVQPAQPAVDINQFARPCLLPCCSQCACRGPVVAPAGGAGCAGQGGAARSADLAGGAKGGAGQLSGVKIGGQGAACLALSTWYCPASTDSSEPARNGSSDRELVPGILAA